MDDTRERYTDEEIGNLEAAIDGKPYSHTLLVALLAKIKGEHFDAVFQPRKLGAHVFDDALPDVEVR